jgi:DNA helicase-2/ATP-dependent DNA helicase PcrA
MIKLDRLNDKQKEAVLADDNKILLVSAAGSGKTRVLTTKVAYLISEKGVSPSNILALTFTNKAAGEMKERVLNLVGDIDKQDINIMTFHSFGVKALRKFINRYDNNFNQNFIILDANDTKKLFQKVMREANDYLCDNGIIAPSDLPDDKEWESYLEIRNDYLARESKDYIDDIEQEYCERFNSFLEKNNSMTFDDLLIRTYLMFKNYPVSLQYYQTLFQYILVDEFQDTDDLQFKILTMLQEKNQRLFAVGDDFQCLPAGTKIKTIDGDKNIEEITINDKLMVASGRGRTTYAPLEEKYSISSKWHNGPLIKITTESGKQISATPEHIIFANQIIDNSYFVYLMYKKELGFRIGMSKTHHLESRAKNGYESRMTQERADKVWIIDTFNTKEEAVFNEQYYAFKYGIPLYVFNESGRGVALKQDLIDKLFKSIDTFSRGKNLLKDLNMFFEYPNCRFKNKPFLKDEKRPIFKRVTLTLFGRYDRKNDNITHELHYCTVNEDFNNTCEKVYGKKASLKKNVYNTKYYNGRLTNKNSDILYRLGRKLKN